MGGDAQELVHALRGFGQGQRGRTGRLALALQTFALQHEGGQLRHRARQRPLLGRHRMLRSAISQHQEAYQPILQEHRGDEHRAGTGGRPVRGRGGRRLGEVSEHDLARLQARQERGRQVVVHARAQHAGPPPRFIPIGAEGGQGAQRAGLLIEGDEAEALAAQDALGQLDQPLSGLVRGPVGAARLRLRCCGLIGRRRLGRLGCLHEGLGHRHQRIERRVGLVLQPVSLGHIPADEHTSRHLPSGVMDGSRTHIDQDVAPIRRTDQDIHGAGAAQRLAAQRPQRGPLLLWQRLAVLIPHIEQPPHPTDRAREALAGPIQVEEFPGRGILVQNTTLMVEDHDAIGHRFQDRGELAGTRLRVALGLAQRFFQPLALGYILMDTCHPNNGPMLIADGGRGGEDHFALPPRGLNLHFLIDDGLAADQRAHDRPLFEGQRLPGVRPPAVPHLKLRHLAGDGHAFSPEGCIRRVVFQHPCLGVHHAHRSGQDIQQRAQAQALPLSRLRLAVQLPPLGDIPEDQHASQHLPSGVMDGSRTHIDQDIVPIERTEQDIRGAGAAQRLAAQRPHPGPLPLRQRLPVLISRVEQQSDLMDCARRALGARIQAGEFPGRGILVHDTALMVEDDDAVGHRFQDRFELTGAGLRRVVVVLLVRSDIRAREHPFPHTIVCVAHGHATHQQAAVAAIRTPDAALQVERRPGGDSVRPDQGGAHALIGMDGAQPATLRDRIQALAGEGAPGSHIRRVSLWLRRPDEVIRRPGARRVRFFSPTSLRCRSRYQRVIPR